MIIIVRIEIILNYCLTTMRKKGVFLTWFLGNIRETWSFNANSVNRQRNRPLQLGDVLFSQWWSQKNLTLIVSFFYKLCVHANVNKTKFERKSSLEFYYTGHCVRKKKNKLKRSIIDICQHSGVFIQRFNTYVTWSLNHLGRTI